MKVTQPQEPEIAIAGASGFVGSRLRQDIPGFRWRALTRSHSVATGTTDITATKWQECDLFSLPRLTESIAGTEAGIYLVHSMLPSSRLVQGSFQDMDLLLADNFIRAAEENGLKHVIYLGGLIPENRSRLSPHLASRLEVESVLRSRSVPVTVIRAGLIFGPGGSSMQMLINLVNRLPVMLLPSWTRSLTQSIDIRDIVRAFQAVLTEPSLQGGTYDIAGHEPMTYRQMILKSAKLLGKRPITVKMPVNYFALSRYWVATVSGVTPQLVNPLLESLKHDLKASPNPLLDKITPGAIPFEQSVRDSVDAAASPLPNPRAASRKSDRKLIKSARRVRSVQRMPLPEGYDAPGIAHEYGSWLTRVSGTIIRVERDDSGLLRFLWLFPRITLLELNPTPYSRKGERRRAFYISGGLLARDVDPPGRFEFRIFPENGCVIAAIHGFAPSLPWYLYECSQAIVHLIVMKCFSRHLKKLSKWQ